MEPVLNYINGAFVPADSGQTLDTINPATNTVITAVARSGPTDVQRATDAAKAASAAWGVTSMEERIDWLERIADALEAESETIAQLESLDTGKPISEAKVVDVHSGADCLEYYGGLAGKLHGHHYQLPGDAFAYTRREPLGICAGIGAWNYPLQIACCPACTHLLLPAAPV